MIKIGKLKNFILATFFGFTLIGMCWLSGQVQTNGKPKKPPDVICDNDGICEWEEAKSSTSKEECEDCSSKTYPPLLIEPYKQVATTGAADFSFSKGKVFQFKYTNGGYRDTWASHYLDGWTRSVSIGDADNDGQKEIITVLEFESGRGKNARRYQKIFLFEDGSDGSPSWKSPEIPLSSIGARDSIIANADNDPDGINEIIIVNDMRVEVYRITFIAPNVYDFEFLWNSPDYENIILSVDVGDVDSDGANEVVLAMSDLGAAIIYEHLGNNSWGNEVITESIGVCNINYAKVRNADSDDLNEIVGGGSPRILDKEACGDLTVWKYDGIGSYFNVFQITPVPKEDISYGVFIQGVGVGDVDGDAQNEVVIGTASADVNLNRIYIYKYIGNSYVKQEPPLDCSEVAQLSVGDIDNDGIDEIVAASHGITIFEYVDGVLIKTFNCAYGGYIEIN